MALKIAVELAPDLADVGDFLADVRALEAAGAEALWVRADGPSDAAVILGALAVLTTRIQIGALGVSELDERQRRALERLSRGRLIATHDPASWPRIEAPRDRAHWKELRALHEEAGAVGIIVPHSDRILDLIRNPDVEDDRSDLNIAVG